MPLHDWTKAGPGLFHDVHTAWIAAIRTRLNTGILPKEYYALAEQFCEGRIPDVLTLHSSTNRDEPAEPSGGVSLLTAPPKVRYHQLAESAIYSTKARVLTVRNGSDNRVVASIEIVSPGNKRSVRAATAFLTKICDLSQSGIHQLIVDPFPPTRRDPNGLPVSIWKELTGLKLKIPKGSRRTFCSLLGGEPPELFVELARVGEALPAMPLFLTRGVYVTVPLEETYEEALRGFPKQLRSRLDKGH